FATGKCIGETFESGYQFQPLPKPSRRLTSVASTVCNALFVLLVGWSSVGCCLHAKTIDRQYVSTPRGSGTLVQSNCPKLDSLEVASLSNLTYSSGSLFVINAKNNS